MADKNSNKENQLIFPTKETHFALREKHGAWELSTFACFTKFLGPGRSLALQAPGLGHSPRTYLSPLLHPHQGTLFVAFYIQDDIHPGLSEWEAFCQGAPGFGEHWEHP